MCDIRGTQITGMKFGSQMIPQKIEVMAQVDCYTVEIKINNDTGELVHAEENMVVESIPYIQPVDGMPRMYFVKQFTPVLPVKCGDLLHVTVTCTDDPSCQRTAIVPVICKDGCSTSIQITTNPPFNPTASCISAGTYEVSVLAPLGTDITYSWLLAPVGSQPTVLAGTGANQTIDVPIGNPLMFLTVTASSPNCQPILGIMLFPQAVDTLC